MSHIVITLAGLMGVSGVILAGIGAHAMLLRTMRTLARTTSEGR